MRSKVKPKIVTFGTDDHSQPVVGSEYVYWNGRFMKTKVYLHIKLKETLSKL